MGRSPIRLVVFDLAGTIVDCGCFGPVAAFRDAFADHGVALSDDEIRGPMGLDKRDHVAALLALPAVAERFRAAHGREATATDVEAIYQAFIPRQREAIARHSEPVDGFVEVAAELERRGVAWATTTGYFRAAAEAVWAALAARGLRPAANVCPEDVGAGRPAPWMIFRAMQACDVYPPAAVVKVGDTAPDIAEGRNAGAWSLGVTRTGSRVACSAADWETLPLAERHRRCNAAADELMAAGAHAVLDSVAGLPAWLDGVPV